MGLFEQDLSFGFFIMLQCELFLLVDVLIHLEQYVLDLVIYFPIDLTHTAFLQPLDFLFEQNQSEQGLHSVLFYVAID